MTNFSILRPILKPGHKAYKTPGRPMLTILPPNNMNSPIQQCAPLKASLQKSACGSRWELGEADREEYGVCRGCPIGAKNYREYVDYD